MTKTQLEHLIAILPQGRARQWYERLLPRLGEEFSVTTEKDQERPTKKPFLIEDGTLSIPFDGDHRYHWWAGGQPVRETLNELGASRDILSKYGVRDS